MSNTFFLRKMRHSGYPRLEYLLGEVKISEYVGRSVTLRFTGRIQCVHCGRSIKKTFGQGHCFPCFQKLAECDSCILKPELCHFRKGTCREPEWALDNCMTSHVVYLGNTSGLKVVITREFKKMERWGDQGALSAVIIAVVPERYYAGLIEVALGKFFVDKTDWRAMVKGLSSEVDLAKEKERAIELMPEEFKRYAVRDGDYSRIHEFVYPVQKYPEKAVVHQPEKEPVISGALEGIRGQYLFIGGKAINIRKYSGYEVGLEL